MRLFIVTDLPIERYRCANNEETRASLLVSRRFRPEGISDISPVIYRRVSRDHQGHKPRQGLQRRSVVPPGLNRLGASSNPTANWRATIGESLRDNSQSRFLLRLSRTRRNTRRRPDWASGPTSRPLAKAGRFRRNGLFPVCVIDTKRFILSCMSLIRRMTETGRSVRATIETGR